MPNFARTFRKSPWRRDPSPTSLGDRLVRFRDPLHAHETLAPFPAYVIPPVPTSEPAATRTGLSEPRFADVSGRRVVMIETNVGDSLYATGEVAGPLLRNATRIRGHNTDCYGYNSRSRTLYQSHPWVLGVHAGGSAFGVILETTYAFEIDLRAGIVLACDGPSPGVVVIERDRPEEVLGVLAELTGTMPMPPLWALGYQQCRWSYEPDEQVRQIAREFRTRRIPCDVIWMDIDYMRGFRCFTFDPEKFPNPAKLSDDLHAQGFRGVWMIDPGIKVDADYSVYSLGRDSDHFIKARDGGEYQGSVWPGPCAFPDFTKSRTRAWWGDLYKDFIAHGIDGVWNDMNEPAIFDGPGKSMRDDARHDADAELGGPDAHARYHNIYGMQMVRATREGITRASPENRPFVLTRSNFLGGHRYAATWTGDNTSNWEHLRLSIPMALNLGLSGQPFVGPDIGGFDGNADATLFARWMGIGALLPFARGHSIKTSVAHEPWSFGEECEGVCRLALRRRYRLMAYLYTLFREASRTGLPIVRPVFFADPRDPSLRTIDHAFLLGRDVLVVADVNPPGVRAAPAGKPGGVLAAWREFDVVDACAELPKLYIRPGAIVPIGPDVQHTGEILAAGKGTTSAERTLLVAPDETGAARGVCYDDAGDGFGYQRGEYAVTEYVFEAGKVTSRVIEGSIKLPVEPGVVTMVL
ncbi:MAG: alpha-glucosidase [Phycisphaerales bacterium]|nr:alpha-glucosidase [Phycisphaerales bacterium]